MRGGRGERRRRSEGGSEGVREEEGEEGRGKEEEGRGVRCEGGKGES